MERLSLHEGGEGGSVELKTGAASSFSDSTDTPNLQGGEGGSDEAQTNAPSWSAVTGDILANVFRRLSWRPHKQDFALTCKGWAELARRSTTVRHIRSRHAISALIKNCSHLPLTHIDCSKVPMISDQELVDLVQAFGRSLTSLNLSGARALGPTAFAAIALHCSALTSLNLSGSLVDDAALESLAGCPTLEALGLRKCEKLTLRGIGGVVPTLGALKEVHLSEDIWGFLIPETREIIEEFLRRLVEDCPQLTELDMWPTLVGIDATSGACQCLGSLWRDGTDVMTPLLLLTAGCPALKKLKIFWAEITPAVLPFLGRCETWKGHAIRDLPGGLALPSPIPLKRLSLAEVDPESLAALLPWMPHLEALEVHPSVWGEWERFWVLLVTLGLHCPELRELRIEGRDSPGFQLCAQQGLAPLAAGCPRLQLLELYKCSFMAEELQSLGSFPDLAVLRVSPKLEFDGCYCGQEQCDSIFFFDHADRLLDTEWSDAVLDAIAAGCRNLVHLELRWCSGYTPAGLRRLVRACPQLQLLKMTPWAEGEDWDSVLGDIGEGARDLQDLEIEWQFNWIGPRPQVSQVGLTALVLHCPLLESIIVKFGLDDDTLALLAQGCPFLRKVKQFASSERPGCTDAGLLHFLEQARCLVSLGISGCESLTATGFRSLLNFPALEELEIDPSMEENTSLSFPRKELEAQHCTVLATGGKAFDPMQVAPIAWNLVWAFTEDSKGHQEMREQESMRE